MKRIVYLMIAFLMVGFVSSGIAAPLPANAKTIKVNSSGMTSAKLTGKIVSEEGYESKIYYLKFSKKVTFKSGKSSHKQKKVEIYIDNSKNPKKWKKYLKKHDGKKVTLKGDLGIGESDYVLFLK